MPNIKGKFLYDPIFGVTLLSYFWIRNVLKKIRVLATFWKFWFVKDFMNFKAKLPKWNVKIFSRNFAGVIFSPKSRIGEFAVGIWKSQGQNKHPNIYPINIYLSHIAIFTLFIYRNIYMIYILGCLFHPWLFQIPTANSPILDFGEKITPAKFREKFLTFHLGSFALKFMKSLTNQNFQNVARIPYLFF